MPHSNPENLSTPPNIKMKISGRMNNLTDNTDDFVTLVGASLAFFFHATEHYIQNRGNVKPCVKIYIIC